jgi:hypothetical protein
MREERKEEKNCPTGSYSALDVMDRSVTISWSAPARQAPNLNIGRQMEHIKTPQGNGMGKK